jgi:hypothetical protein
MKAVSQVPERIQEQIAMSEEDEQGGYKPDHIEIILLPVQQMVFQPLGMSRPW